MAILRYCVNMPCPESAPHKVRENHIMKRDVDFVTRPSVCQSPALHRLLGTEAQVCACYAGSLPASAASSAAPMCGKLWSHQPLSGILVPSTTHARSTAGSHHAMHPLAPVCPNDRALAWFGTQGNVGASAGPKPHGQWGRVNQPGTPPPSAPI